jgi:hypothetical protein
MRVARSAEVPKKVRHEKQARTRDHEEGNVNEGSHGWLIG